MNKGWLGTYKHSLNSDVFPHSQDYSGVGWIFALPKIHAWSLQPPVQYNSEMGASGGHRVMSAGPSGKG